MFIGTSGQMNYILIKKQRGNFKEWNPFYRNSTIFDQPIWIFNGIEGIIIGVGEMATIKSVVLNYPHEIAISSLKISSKYSHNINVKDIYFNHLTSNSFLLKDFKKKIYNQFTDTFNN